MAAEVSTVIRRSVVYKSSREVKTLEDENMDLMIRRVQSNINQDELIAYENMRLESQQTNSSFIVVCR